MFGRIWNARRRRRASGRLGVGSAPSGARRRKQLRTERLEARILLDSEGVLAGLDAYHTLSFAPDGTEIAGHTSALNTTFSPFGAPSVWQNAILEAFQSWALHTNADVGVVTDNGSPFGSPGGTQGDERFGDIRIGAAPLSSEVLAISVPADRIFSGSWAADVIFNSNGNFTSMDDLYSVALHEAGHVFGLEHNETNPDSVMHVHGPSDVLALHQDDIYVLQSLHGVRLADLNELDLDGGPGNSTIVVPNDSIADATELKLGEAFHHQEGTAPAIIYGDVTDVVDVDFYSLELPDGYTGTATIEVRTAGVSLLAPQLRVFNANEQLIAQAEAFLPGGAGVFVQLNPTSDTLYLSVGGATSDVYSIGGYSLIATLDELNVIPQETIDEIAGGEPFRFLDADDLRDILDADEHDPFNDDGHADDDVGHRGQLDTSPGYVEGTHYQIVASIADTTDIDFFSVKTPGDLSPDPSRDVMTIRVESLDTAGLIPNVSVFDENDVPVPVSILANGNGELVAQVSGVELDTDYSVSIEAKDPNGPFSTGNYRLTVAFQTLPEALETYAAGTLTSAGMEQTHTIYVAETHMFHFLIDVDLATAEEKAGIFVTLRVHEDGAPTSDPLLQFAASTGETRSTASVLLTPGTYDVQFAGMSDNAGGASDLVYTLHGAAITDPFAIDPVDVGEDPFFQCPNGGDSFCYPDGTVTLDAFWWNLFTGALPDPPAIEPIYLEAALTADWWSRLWTDNSSNAAPTAAIDEFTTPTNQPLATHSSQSLLANDVDPDSLVLVAVLATETQNGVVSLNLDGTFTYLPAAGFMGVDQFTYQAFDFQASSASTTVLINVIDRADFDQDFDVDGDDFLTWQAGFGTPGGATNPNGDADGDGDVDGDDFLIWQSSFLVSSGGGSASIGVSQAVSLSATKSKKPENDGASILANTPAVREQVFSAERDWRINVVADRVTQSASRGLSRARRIATRIRAFDFLGDPMKDVAGPSARLKHGGSRAN